MAIVNGTSGTDHLSGTTSNDFIDSGSGFDYMYGGAGNDTFAIKLSDMNTSLNSANSQAGKGQDYIEDFHGAGGWNGTDNDFVAFAGFGAASTLTYTGHALQDASVQYYSIHSSTTGLDYSIIIHSVNGAELTKGDYNFYG